MYDRDYSARHAYFLFFLRSASVLPRQSTLTSCELYTSQLDSKIRLYHELPH